MPSIASILNVDSDDERRTARTRLLSEAGYHVSEATTETDGLATVALLTPHLVVLAGHKPPLGKTCLCRALKEAVATQPMVLVISGRAAIIEEEDGGPRVDDADLVLSESISEVQFLATVRALMRVAHRRNDVRRLSDDLEQAERSVSNAGEDVEQREVLGALQLELREATEALRQREQQLRIVTDSVPSLISYVDRDECYRFVNAGYEDTFGLPRQHIIGRTVKELLGATYEDVAPYVRRALAGETVRFESRLVYAGRPRWVLASYTPDLLSNGTVAGFYVLVMDISQRIQQEEELRGLKDQLELRVNERTQALAASQERLRTLAAQLSLAEQRERRKLASNMHDYLAQLLVVGMMKLDAVRKVAVPPTGPSSLDDVHGILQQTLTYVRTMIAELCPPTLQQDGFAASLKWLSERMQKYGLQVDIQADTDPVRLPEDRAVFLFQSARELLFNVLKHAGVDRATVSLSAGSSGSLSLTVEDSGRGMDAEALCRSTEPGHFGLLSVRERMEAMGGALIVGPRPGGGTRVELALPYNIAGFSASTDIGRAVAMPIT